MTSTKYQAEDLENWLKKHTNWQCVENKLYRRLVFEDFVHAFSFITQIALLAEKMNHHPEWANVYRTVDVYLTSHDIEGISERDLALAVEIDRIVGE